MNGLVVITVPDCKSYTLIKKSYLEQLNENEILEIYILGDKVNKNWGNYIDNKEESNLIKLKEDLMFFEEINLDDYEFRQGHMFSTEVLNETLDLLLKVDPSKTKQLSILKV